MFLFFQLSFVMLSFIFKRSYELIDVLRKQMEFLVLKCYLKDFS